jgi:antirestriction protein ArdC
MNHEPLTDLHTRVTERIVADLEHGVRPWQRPWNAAHAAGPVSRPLRHNGTPYRGINVLLLWIGAMEKHYAAPIWMTYKQAGELGGHVRRAEHGALVVIADRYLRTETDEEGNERVRQIPFLKGYTVFNVEQIDGLPEKFHARAEPPKPVGRLERAERFFAATGATIREGGNQAFYDPSADVIQMPPRDSFRDAGSFFGTLAHEGTHWTGHASRLARHLGRRFGDEAYAAEELIAEMGAAFLCADLGITPEIREDHAQYLSAWLAVLKSDHRAIFTAASHAQRAADYLHRLQEVTTAAA